MCRRPEDMLQHTHLLCATDHRTHNAHDLVDVCVCGMAWEAQRYGVVPKCGYKLQTFYYLPCCPNYSIVTNSNEKRRKWGIYFCVCFFVQIKVSHCSSPPSRHYYENELCLFLHNKWNNDHYNLSVLVGSNPHTHTYTFTKFSSYFSCFRINYIQKVKTGRQAIHLKWNSRPFSHFEYNHLNTMVNALHIFRE